MKVGVDPTFSWGPKILTSRLSFCLWPFRYIDYRIKNSGRKNILNQIPREKAADKAICHLISIKISFIISYQVFLNVDGYCIPAPIQRTHYVYIHDPFLHSNVIERTDRPWSLYFELFFKAVRNTNGEQSDLYRHFYSSETVRMRLDKNKNDV